MESNNGRVIVVAGLHYGDEGKGTTVDYLTKQYEVSAVLRCGGGGQAAHHVVRDDGAWHCFSHYCSGTFHECCKYSILTRYVVVYPQTLVRQTEALKTKMKNPLKKLKIDLECHVVTPYHQLLSRVFELLREKKKGTTGQGIGRAAQDVYASNPAFYPFSEILAQKKEITTMQIKHLLNQETRQHLLKKIHDEKIQQISKLMKMTDEQLISALYHEKELIALEQKPIIDPLKKKQVLKELIAFTSKNSPKNLGNCLQFYSDFVRQYEKCFINTQHKIESLLKDNKTIIFQGSQGALLDPIYGFFPHTTKTLCTDSNVKQILSRMSVKPKMTKVGVLRCYSSRHGAGPFPTFDETLTKLLPQRHNANDGWEGSFRIGLFDVVAAQYGISIFQPDTISLTCLDRLMQLPQESLTKICTSYMLKEPMKKEQLQENFQYDQMKIQRIKLQNPQKAYRNTTLTKIMNMCLPIYSSITLPKDQTAIIQRIMAYAKQVQKFIKIPISMVSMSPSISGKIQLKPLKFQK